MATVHGYQNLIPPSRNQTHTPCLWKWEVLTTGLPEKFHAPYFKGIGCLLSMESSKNPALIDIF